MHFSFYLEREKNSKIKTKPTNTFCGVDIDMNRFEDYTKRDAQSVAKLYNQESVHGTKGAELFVGLKIYFIVERFYSNQQSDRISG